MTKDFAKQHPQSFNYQQKPSKQPQTPQAKTLSKPMKTLIIVGASFIAISFLAGYLGEKTALHHNNQAITTKIPKVTSNTHTTPTTNTAAKTTVAKADTVKKPEFDFYTVLPERKVTPVLETATQTTEAEKQQFLYMVQVGSYQQKARAQSVESRLKKLGLTPSIDVTANGWFRVDFGPFESKRQADAMRHRIQQENIIGSIIRPIKQSKEAES